MPPRAVIRVGPGSSTLRGRWFGARLREHREAAGRTAGEVAKQMQRSHSTLSRWESGGMVPRRPDVLFMLDLYGVSGTERDALLQLHQDAYELHDASEVVSVAVADYGWLEGRAWKLETFQEAALPGLLQTPEYAREVLKTWDPAASRDRIERVLAARMARQERLTGDDPVKLSVILGEGALRRPIGGPEIMRAQLRHLVDRAALPNVEVRLLPNAAGAHAGLSGSFIILRFRDDRDLVYVLTRGGDIYFEDPVPFAQALRRLAKAALPPRKSVAMIAAMTRETDMPQPAQTTDADLRGVAWRKSSRSEAGGECVEIALLPDRRVAVRHSRHPDAAALIYTPGEWDAFLGGAKDGEFDLP